MGQLALFTETTPSSKPTAPVAVGQWYCDVFVHSVWDEKRKRIRIKPLPEQAASEELFVSCSHKARNGPVDSHRALLGPLFPAGTVFKMDVRLAQGKKGKNTW